jgi:hypothetical protein
MTNIVDDLLRGSDDAAREELHHMLKRIVSRTSHPPKRWRGLC